MENNNQPKKSQSLRDHIRELGLDPTAEDYLDGIFVKIIVVFFVAFAVFPYLYFVFTDPSTPQGLTCNIWKSLQKQKLYEIINYYTQSNF